MYPGEESVVMIPTHRAVVTEPLPQGLVDPARHQAEGDEQQAGRGQDVIHLVETVTSTRHLPPLTGVLWPVLGEGERKASLNIQVKPCLGPVPTDWSKVWQLSILTTNLQGNRYFTKYHFYLSITGKMT